MPNRMDITAVTPDDLPDLSKLGADTFTETFGHLYPPEDLSAFLARSYGLDAIRRDTENPRHFWRIVRDKGEAIAYLHCGPVALPHPDAHPVKEGELKRIYIRQSHQGRGLGRVLMDVALDWMADTYNTAPQWIGVWSENHKAQRLYGSFGFVKVGAYDFPVGQTMDHEFILRRLP